MINIKKIIKSLEFYWLLKSVKEHSTILKQREIRNTMASYKLKGVVIM